MGWRREERGGGGGRGERKIPGIVHHASKRSLPRAGMQASRPCPLPCILAASACQYAHWYEVSEALEGLALHDLKGRDDQHHGDDEQEHDGAKDPGRLEAVCRPEGRKPRGKAASWMLALAPGFPAATTTTTTTTTSTTSLRRLRRPCLLLRLEASGYQEVKEGPERVRELAGAQVLEQ